MKVFKTNVTKRIALYATVVIILIIAGVCVNRVNKKFLQIREEIEVLKEELIKEDVHVSTDNAIVTEMMVLQRSCHLDCLPHHVLCIGNSITLHQPLGDINWYSCHGMAASKPENDYCHILEKMMRQHNPTTTVTPVSLVPWERDFSIDIDSLLKEDCEGKDIIVIRIGENVVEQDIPEFAGALSKLVEYCQQYTKNIVVTGQYWPERQKELAVVQVVRDYSLVYVPLYWIWNLYEGECSLKEGDTLYNTEGQPYQVEGEDILTHPNDKGMELIARSIYNSL